MVIWNYIINYIFARSLYITSAKYLYNISMRQFTLNLTATSKTLLL